MVTLGAAGYAIRAYFVNQIVSMETPPVCNYEGSDYQQSFWDMGGREYEDAAEAVALKKLLPDQGGLLLELGAGAGRNTPRYAGYDKIILLDYSVTQLQQAQARLGRDDRYRYVAADIYKLPFSLGIFDAATMIRTLHHMADARLALQEINNVMKKDAVFILEYANKRNIKSIIRYIFRKQTWDPFSPEPVEFAPLNFDFHPATILSWMTECKFVVDQQLAVSYFRMGWLKRHVPINILVTLDSLLQPTGNIWQYSPSVFIRSHNSSSNISTSEDSIFRCPVCRNSPLPDTPPLLTCPNCKQVFSVIDGIYDLRPNSPYN